MDEAWPDTCDEVYTQQFQPRPSQNSNAAEVSTKLKENFTLIHGIWLLLINQNFL